MKSTTAQYVVIDKDTLTVSEDIESLIAAMAEIGDGYNLTEEGGIEFEEHGRSG